MAFCAVSTGIRGLCCAVRVGEQVARTQDTGTIQSPQASVSSPTLNWGRYAISNSLPSLSSGPWPPANSGALDHSPSCTGKCRLCKDSLSVGSACSNSVSSHAPQIAVCAKEETQAVLLEHPLKASSWVDGAHPHSEGVSCSLIEMLILIQNILAQQHGSVSN